MKDLEINYSLPKNLQYVAFAAGAMLFALSVGICVSQAVAKNYSFFFFVGLLGVVMALALVLIFYFTQTKPIIVITDEHFHVYNPKKRIDGMIEWDDVEQLGIGLSYITFKTVEDGNYKIDLENLKYADIRAIKSRLIEICEEKDIAFNNVNKLTSKQVDE